MFREALGADREKIIALSLQWQREDITYGYHAMTADDLTSYRVWCAAYGDEVVGYLMGRGHPPDDLCVFPSGKRLFLIEDFYVAPPHRGSGLGKSLHGYVQSILSAEGIAGILLSSATKDHLRIQRFYTQEAGYTVWTTTFFKSI